jgi:hypothetical protein
LYIVSSAAQIIKIVLDSNNNSIQSVTPIGTSVPTCEGAVTASFAGNYNSIVGFSGPDAIKICQIDGTYQMLCPNLNAGGTPGAAAIRLQGQNPQPISCIPTGIEAAFSTNSLWIFPNPALEELHIQLPQFGNFSYNIINATGKVVQTNSFDYDSTAIKISNLTNGIYSIVLLHNNKSYRKSFIVEK